MTSTISFKNLFFFTLILSVFYPSVHAQKKEKIKTIGYLLRYNNKIYEGVYNGTTVKSKVDSKKMDLPNGSGFFQGYIENSGKKSVVFADQYKDVVALQGTSWTPKIHSAKIAANMDFSIEVAVQLKRLDGNTGGAQIKLFSDETKKNFLIFSLQEYKKEPYDTATASVIDKSLYLTAKTAFKNVLVNGTVGGVAVEESMKYYGMDYSKFNTLKIIKKSRIIEVYVNNVQQGIVELPADFALNQVTLDKDASHNVFYDYIQIDQIAYNQEDRLSYNGDWSEGLFQGQGELLYYGGKITGQFSGGNLNGEGKAVFKDYTYTGNFKNGTPEGKGKIVTPDYDYNGDVVFWSPNGYGKKVFKKQFQDDGNDGLIFNQLPYYLGNFKDGLMSGKGTLHYRNGDSLNGNWNNDLFTGKGKLKLKDGSIYDGDWLNGKKHGKGKLIYSDGTVVQGDFANDGFNGLAKLKLEDGGIFEGQLVNGKPSGSGTITYSNGGKLKGTWTESGFNGTGRKNYEKMFEDGDDYCYEEGTWVNSKLEGQGKKVYRINDPTDGTFLFFGTYEGMFKNGQFNGNGKLSYADMRANNTVVAEWQNNVCRNGTIETIVHDIDGTVKWTYKGEMKDYGIPEGNGQMVDYEGAIYIGRFKNGLAHGQGKKTYPNGMVEEGEFIEGEFKKPFQCKTAKIGNQTWMGENLKVTTFKNGDPILEARTIEQWNEAGRTGKPAFSYYNNDPSTADKYGVLYNWFAVNDPRGLAPEGWRVPTLNDAKIMVQFLDNDILRDEELLRQKWAQGVNSTAFETEMRKKYGDILVKRNGSSVWTSNPVYGETKLRSKSGWSKDKQGTDAFGFNAQQTVSRFKGDFLKEENKSQYWLNDYRKSDNSPLHIEITEAGYTPPHAWQNDMYGNPEYIYARSVSWLAHVKSLGLPVRCVKN